MIRHFLTRQFIVFLAVGGTAALLNWVARMVLSHWLSFSEAVCLAYGAGMFVAFVLNKRFVFSQSTRPVGLQVRDFVITNLAFAPVVWIAAVALNNELVKVGWLYYPEAFAHGLAIAVPMLATFLIYKFFAFGNSHER